MDKFNQAVKLFNANRLEEADSLVSEILSDESSAADSYHLLALIKKARKQYNASESSFLKSLEFAANQPIVLANYANLLVVMGRYEEADGRYVDSIQMMPSNTDAISNRIALLINQKKFDVADDFVRDKNKFVGSSSSITTQLIRLFQAQKRYSESLALLDEARIKWPKVNEFIELRIIALYGLGRFDEVVDLYRKNSQQAISATVFYYSGLAFFDLGDVQAATNMLRECVRLEPEFVVAHDALNNIIWSRGLNEHFCQSFKDSLTINPNSRKLWFSYAANLLLADKLQEAKLVLENAMLKIGRKAEFLHALSVVEYRSKKLRSSEMLLDEALELSPENIRYLIDRANIHILHGDYGSALQLLELANTIDNTDQEVWAYLGVVWRLTGNQRYSWLNNYPKLVHAKIISIPKGFSDLSEFLSELQVCLLKMHNAVRQPLDQSVRNGTQTVGHLLEGSDPTLRALKSAIDLAVVDYLEQLDLDETHPVQFRNLGGYEIQGSWSVRLAAEGFHVNHVHPKGWLSCCFYVSVPQEIHSNDDSKVGWLKFGETSLDLPGVDLPPDKCVCPVEGLLVIFPSYMWHGTYPYLGAGARVTVPCDIQPSVS